MKYRAATRFTTTVMRDGMNVVVMCDKDATVDLDETIAELVNRDIPGVLTLVKPPKKTTAKKNRQVTKADSDE